MIIIISAIHSVYTEEDHSILSTSSNTNSIIIIIIAHHHLGDTNMTYSYTSAAAVAAEDACPDEMMRQRWDRNAISRKHCQDAV